jgi:hypothetical protein
VTTIIEYLREQAVNKLFSLSTFTGVWPTWRPEIRRIIGLNPHPNSTINLGDSLSAVFKTTSVSGRSQGTVSSGGAAWEALVCWYLNFCLMESRTVVMRKSKNFMPKAIFDAITVIYGTFPSNTESDLVAITFPNLPVFNQDITTLNVLDHNGRQIPNQKRGRFNYTEIIDRLAEQHFSSFELGIIQCKTNWNDNAQIPMLWDIVYSAGGFPSRNISVGTSTYRIVGLQRFTYSFITVPSNNPARLNANSTAVRRVSYISGGNYWGRPTNAGVANSIKDIFGKNFSSGSMVNLAQDLTAALGLLSTKYAYFQI